MLAVDKPGPSGSDWRNPTFLVESVPVALHMTVVLEMLGFVFASKFLIKVQNTPIRPMKTVFPTLTVQGLGSFSKNKVLACFQGLSQFLIRA